MLKLQIVRPNTIGTTVTKEFENYSAAEDYIERKVERLADNGWECTELQGSNSNEGAIECTHDYKADILIIQWSKAGLERNI